MGAMRYVHVSASGKINPALYVGDVREDGYHDLDIFFESLDIFDEIEARACEGSEVSLVMQGAAEGVPCDDTNLAVRAARLLQERYGVTQGVELTITKRIPVAGGMAGGSADAAGALLACSELWELGLGRDELMELGAELGADVPFCLLGSLARASGKGEVLHSIQPGYMHFWTLLTFPEGLSTPEVFNRLDALREEKGIHNSLETTREAADKLEELLGQPDNSAFAPYMVNDLTEAVCALRPELGEILERISDMGLARIVSGAGPTIAILSEDYETANAVANHLIETVPEATIKRANGPAAGAHLRHSE